MVSAGDVVSGAGTLPETLPDGKIEGNQTIVSKAEMGVEYDIESVRTTKFAKEEVMRCKEELESTRLYHSVQSVLKSS